MIGASPRAAAMAASDPLTTIGMTSAPPIAPARRCTAILRDAARYACSTSSSIHAVNSAPWTWNRTGNDGVGKDALQVVGAGKPQEDREGRGDGQAHEEPAAKRRSERGADRVARGGCGGFDRHDRDDSPGRGDVR